MAHFVRELSSSAQDSESIPLSQVAIPGMRYCLKDKVFGPLKRIAVKIAFT